MSGSLRDQSRSASSETFVTALVLNAIVFGAELTAFTIFRPHFKAIYEPRTYAPPASKRVPPLSKHSYQWPLSIFKADPQDIIRVNGLDSYFFVRFLRMMAKMFLPIWIISWAVLLPATSVNILEGVKKGVDMFIFGNIGPEHQKRYVSHIILVYFFTFWVFYNIKHEMRHFLLTRQLHLINTEHAKSSQAKTLLITGIPAKYISEQALQKLFNDLPGGVRKIWINRNLKELPDIYERRIAAENKLESAETQLLKIAAKARLSEMKKRTKASGGAADVEATHSVIPVVQQDQRPQHRLGWLPFHGKKVDTIEWARNEIRVCTQLLEEARSIIEHDEKTSKTEEETDKKYPPHNSAFVMFNTQIAVHLAKQALVHHEPYRMRNKYVEVSPDDIIWANLNMNPYEQKLRMVVSYAATAGLVILWSFPVAFVGVVSNVPQLCSTVHWLAWICQLPKIVVGIIAGILPPVLLALLMILLPIVLRLLARLEGIPKYSGLELSLMSRFFIFQVIHSFLIVTLSSGLIAALPGIINNPTSVPSILAQNLPQASTFFLTYVLLQGLSGAGAGFLQIVPLLIYYVKLFILGSTPRSVYEIKYGLQTVAWGTLFPQITLLTVIALAYSIISPIINGLAFGTFFLFYMLYKYLFLWVYDQPSTQDTGGLFFPKAIQHVFVGLYVQQLCLAALFFLARSNDGGPGAAPEGALMVALIILTALFHAMVNDSYDPLLQALPMTLANKTTSCKALEGTSGENLPPLETSVSPSSEVMEETVDDPKVSPIDRPKPKEDDFNGKGFAHPAISRRQRTVWLPRDELGLAEEEEKACREAGVEANMGNATMDDQGKVDITGRPPDDKEE